VEPFRPTLAAGVETVAPAAAAAPVAVTSAEAYSAEAYSAAALWVGHATFCAQLLQLGP